MQALLQRLLDGVLEDIVGEEDAIEVNIDAPPFSAGAIVAPQELDELIVHVRGTIDELAVQLRETSSPVLGSLTAFLDPIDGAPPPPALERIGLAERARASSSELELAQSRVRLSLRARPSCAPWACRAGTREFCSGRGGACTICIGFGGTDGEVVGGAIGAPLPPPRSAHHPCSIHQPHAAPFRHARPPKLRPARPRTTQTRCARARARRPPLTTQGSSTDGYVTVP